LPPCQISVVSFITSQLLLEKYDWVTNEILNFFKCLHSYLNSTHVIRTRVHAYTHTHTSTQIHTYTSIRSHMRVYICSFLHTNKHVRTHTFMRVYVHVWFKVGVISVGCCSLLFYVGVFLTQGRCNLILVVASAVCLRQWISIKHTRTHTRTHARNAQIGISLSFEYLNMCCIFEMWNSYSCFKIYWRVWVLCQTFSNI
jgi:hypothetical protein